MTKIKSFTCTSTKPYDRHYYTVNKKRFDDYEQLRAYWFMNTFAKGETVVVHDCSGQGF